MKPLIEFILACLLVSLAGCSAIAGIFKAGVWSLGILVASVIGLIVFFTTKARH